MSSFFGCFSLGLMRLIRRPGRLLGLVLLPCLVLLAGLLLPSDELEQPLEAGVCLPADTPGALELLDILQQSDPQYVVFHAASEQEIYDHVSAGRWECGFVLSRDFETSYPKENPGRLATLVRARSSTLSPLLADVFSAALFHLRAPDLASGYAGQTGLATGAALDELKQVVADGVSTKMGLAVQTIDGTAQEHPHLGAATAAAFCRGLCAVALFLYALLLAADLSACTSEGWFVRTAAPAGSGCSLGWPRRKCWPLLDAPLLLLRLRFIFSAVRFRSMPRLSCCISGCWPGWRLRSGSFPGPPIGCPRCCPLFRRPVWYFAQFSLTPEGFSLPPRRFPPPSRPPGCSAHSTAAATVSCCMRA